MELVHALNRGVDKRIIFVEESDYVRFVHDMWEFNDPNPTSHAHHSFKNLGFVNPNLKAERIVDIHGWCLMKNHYHLLLSERCDGGLTLFLRKLNVGYANYFNEKYERQGSLFQGRTKKINILSDAHFFHILNYIHFNPLDYLSGARNWRAREIADAMRAQEYLEKYRWSSYNDYCGRKNFPSILTDQPLRRSTWNIPKENTLPSAQPSNRNVRRISSRVNLDLRNPNLNTLQIDVGLPYFSRINYARGKKRAL